MGAQPLSQGDKEMIADLFLEPVVPQIFLCEEGRLTPLVDLSFGIDDPDCEPDDPFDIL